MNNLLPKLLPNVGLETKHVLKQSVGSRRAFIKALPDISILLMVHCLWSFSWGLFSSFV